MDNYTVWINLCQKAARYLTSDQFTRWMFMVGTNGSDEERTGRGEIALDEMMRQPMQHNMPLWMEYQKRKRESAPQP